MSKHISQRQLLESQLTENKFVKEVKSNFDCLYFSKKSINNEIKSKELDLLKGEDTVYKLVGPVLLKQDLVEAVQTVQKRIDYIQGEM